TRSLQVALPISTRGGGDRDGGGGGGGDLEGLLEGLHELVELDEGEALELLDELVGAELRHDGVPFGRCSAAARCGPARSGVCACAAWIAPPGRAPGPDQAAAPSDSCF